MRLRSKFALGGGVASAFGLLGVAVGGMVAGGAVVIAGPAPVAHADGLTSFDDCAALRDWYVSRALKEVGPYGWGGGPLYYQALGGTMARDFASLSPVPASADRAAKVSEQSGSATGTNVQETGVDEPDLAKTDGRLVVRLIDGGKLVVTDVSGTEPRELGRLDLPGDDVYGGELLLLGDHVLVLTGDTSGTVRPMIEGDLVIGRIGRPWNTGTKILDVDISDPSRPRVTHVDRYDGTLLSARLYGDQVRLVTSSGRPDLPFTYPHGKISEDDAVRRNRALVRETTVEDWVPRVTTNGQTSPLVDCADVLHPDVWSGSDTVAVTTFPADDVTARTSIAVTATAQVAYSSTDRLYVASTRVPEPRWSNTVSSRRPSIPTLETTDVYAFALDGAATSYVGAGSFKGTVRDRWSLDSYDGVLRAAWTRWSDSGRVRNGITTLVERDGALVRAGEIDDLGIDENIQAVRWFDDLAVVVTFRQTDPLYTIDLTDPARPRTLGALKIPGYSGYLHPIGDDRLLGLGVDADADGFTHGAQAGVFKIADLTDPRRIGRLDFPDGSFGALDDPRGFTWLSDRDTGLTTLSDWQTGKGRLIALEVSPSGLLESRVVARGLDGWQARVLPLADGRIAVVDGSADHALRLLDLG